MPADEFLDRLIKKASGHERIIVIGQIDTGKSTLIRNMADHMDAYVLDADVGQNDIGPPSVVSLGERVDGHYLMIDGYFSGSTTPSRHFLQMIAGISRLLLQCRNRPVLINTTGLATGEIGRALKTEKINAIKPDLIIGLETGNELKYLDAFARAGAEVLKFRPHPQVTSRSRSDRERLRAEMFRAHFKGALTYSHRLDELSVERLLLCNGVPGNIELLTILADTPVAHAEITAGEAFVVFSEMPGNLEKVASELDVSLVHYCCAADFNGTLVGLMGPKGNLLGLGIIESVDFVNGTIHIFSTSATFSVLQLGSIKLDAASFRTAGSFSPQVYRHKH
jgi:polynucleotide 5'-hydroxyl-kinase GRC3/NOL9